MSDQDCDPAFVVGEAADLESSIALLRRARSGDLKAQSKLLTRYRRDLGRWAHGRLPAYAREGVDTDDLVQITLVRALKALERPDAFEPKHEGAFLAYLRQILINQIRDEVRRARRHPERGGIDPNQTDGAPSPLDQAMAQDFLACYEESLAQLSSDQRRAAVLRLEFGSSYLEIAQALGRPSENAARLLTSRAILRLARLLKVHKS